MNRRLTIALSLCGLGAGLTARCQGPGRQQPRMILIALDLDHDGTLSAAEIQAAPTSLLKLDRNGDGQLTSDELSPRPENAGAAPDELVKQLMSFDKNGKGFLVPADLPERMQGLFQRADANHDGRLTPEEIHDLSARQGMPTGAEASPGHAGGIFRMDPLLNALDTDHDGILSSAEIATASTSLLTLDRNGDGRLTADEIPMRQQTAQERADHMLGEWDTNQDGKISRAEAPEGMLKQFDTIDKNGDGFLEKDELTDFFKSQESQPHNGAPQAGGSSVPNH